MTSAFPPPAGIDRAIAHLRAGETAAAEQICRDLIARGEDAANAWHLRGVLDARSGRHEQALTSFECALRLEPRRAGFLLNLGVSHQALGRTPEAEAAFRAALAVDPEFPEALNNLANVLHNSGRQTEAIQAWQKALTLRPTFTEAIRNFSRVLIDDGNVSEALAMTLAAVQQQSNDPIVAVAAGDALLASRRYEEAVNSYRRALQAGAAPDSVRSQLCDALRQGGKAEDALAEALTQLQWNLDDADAHIQASASLGSLGRTAEAEAHIRQALHLRPDDAEARHNLAVLMVGRRRMAEAIELFRAALGRNPNLKKAMAALARALCSSGEFEEAEAILRDALGRAPHEAMFHSALGEVISNQGRLRESQAAFRESLRCDPAQPAVESSLLFTRVLDPSVSPEDLKAEHGAWAARHAAVKSLPPRAQDLDQNRPLRIGYVSPDLCGHVVAKFFAPVLQHHDRRRVHVTCYADIAVPDDVTRALNRQSGHWRMIRGRSDADVAAQIRDDGIDFLVDLAGHTGARLGVFARRPAPLQATWLGYPATTGLSAIQFFFGDRHTLPVGRESAMVETVVRLPESFCCFSPSGDAPPVSSAPYERVGEVTFGATHKLAKLNDSVLDSWCRVLGAVPFSRLLIYRDGLRGKTAESLRCRLLDRGLDTQRLELRHHAGGNHLNVYSEIDILLDTWPWSGHATACEALWQGVPTLTFRGASHASRMVASTLEQVGLSEWITDSVDEFVAAAQRLAGDRASLTELRRGLRDRMCRSPLCDARRFTAHLEDTYRALWRSWVQQQRSSAQ